VRGWLRRIAGGLEKTRRRVADRVEELFRRGGKVDEALFEELEEILIAGDVGPELSVALVDRLRDRVRRGGLADPSELRPLLAEEILRVVGQRAPSGPPVPPPREGTLHVVSFVGVNGVGKTTTIGKLAHRYVKAGHRPLVVASDTFRAAASEQLEIWARRAGVDLVRGRTGADPGAVAYDGVQAARARGATALFVDTAGRLQTNRNLMAELQKIHRVLGKACPGAPHEVLLVLDAVVGQNALSQARQFRDAVGVTGLVLTKLDGTARGGAVLPILHEMELPILWVGVGEGLEDLEPFDPEAFVEALLRPTSAKPGELPA
jgi:fused signal recognition particle receptor